MTARTLDEALRAVDADHEPGPPLEQHGLEDPLQRCRRSEAARGAHGEKLGNEDRLAMLFEICMYMIESREELVLVTLEQRAFRNREAQKWSEGQVFLVP